MSLCAVFVLQTKTAQIVGVAGTDVPVEDIKKLLLLHEVSVVLCRGADKSLARPRKKQATATEDFDVYISYL
jgi:hypothetical protein